MPSKFKTHSNVRTVQNYRRHRTNRQKENESKRRKESKDTFYGCKHWRRLRRWHLNRHPLCEACAELGLVVPATEVDHIIPRAVAPELRYDTSNLQALCKGCHSRKTRQDAKSKREKEIGDLSEARGDKS